MRKLFHEKMKEDSVFYQVEKTLLRGPDSEQTRIKDSCFDQVKIPKNFPSIHFTIIFAEKTERWKIQNQWAHGGSCLSYLQLCKLFF